MNENQPIKIQQSNSDKQINVELTNTNNLLENINLSINQDKVYRSFCSSEGVLTGVVRANGGFAVPNVRIAAFVPIDSIDSNNEVIKFLYPYEKVTDVNSENKRYNLLPRNSRYIKIFKKTFCKWTPQPPTTAPLLTDNNIYGTYYANNKLTYGINANGNKPIKSDAWILAYNQPADVFINAPIKSNNNSDGLNTPTPSSVITSTYGLPAGYASFTLNQLGGTEYNSDGYYLSVRQDDYSRLNAVVSLGNSVSSNLTPKLDGVDFTETTFSYQNRKLFKNNWNEAHFVPPKNYALWSIIGLSAMTFRNVLIANDSYNANVTVKMYTITKSKYTPQPPADLPNQVGGWRLESDDCSTQGTSTYSAIIDLGVGSEVAVGSMPTDWETTSDTLLQYVKDKYYKYSTTTNLSGEYCILGIPTGNHVIHLDCDLSDVGTLSFTANQLIDSGFNKSLFENIGNGNYKFKKSNDLQSLPQIITQNSSVFVNSLWGDTNVCNKIGVTRYDWDINISAVPTATFFFNFMFDSDGVGGKYYWKNGSSNDSNTGKWSNLAPSVQSATYELVFTPLDKNLNVITNFKPIQVKIPIDNINGMICVSIPMIDDYVTTDEFGNQIPSNDKSGFPTTARYRIQFQPQNVVAGGGTFTLRNPCFFDNVQGDQNRYFKFTANRIYSVKTRIDNNGVNFAILNDNDFNSQPGINVLSSENGIRNSHWINGFIYLPRIDYNSKPSFVRTVGNVFYNIETRIIDVTKYMKTIANDNTFSAVINTGTQLPNNFDVTKDITPQDADLFNGIVPPSDEQAPGIGDNNGRYYFCKGITAGRNLWKQALTFANIVK